ncbi:uncharacterized protein LOC115884703, partial [Sitophilus oryzae]
MAEADAELKQLKNIRATHKAQLTRFRNFLDKFKTQDVPDLVQLELRMNSLEGILDSFNTTQTNIEALDVDTSEDEHSLTRCNFEDNYFELMSIAKRFLSLHAVQNEPNVSIHSSSSGIQEASTPNIKLPQITLPTFDGSYEHWLFFKDTFESLIHKEPSIPLINKFHYLRLSLKGQAADLLKSLECSSSNYEVAWQLLVDRYENKQLLVKNHIKALFQLDSISKESFSGLRNLLDSMTRHLRALEVLGQPVSSWDALLIHLVSSKLDNNSRREWEADSSKLESITIADFTKFLQEKCKILESIQSTQTPTTSRNIRGMSVSKHTPKCCFCQKEHTIYNCNSFIALNVHSRLSEVKRLKLCINCLRNNHVVKDCRSIPCRKCQQRHNTLLHIDYTQNSKTKPIQNSPDQSSNESSSSNHEINQDNISSNTINLSVSSFDYKSANVLLSTAVVNIFDSNGRSHTCRILLDNGSEASFISESLFEKLKLPSTAVNLSITGIAQNQAKVLKQTKLLIESRQSNFKININCLVLPKITSKIPSFVFDKSDLNIPANLILADPSYHIPGSVDLLIGADYFWDLLNIGQIKLGKDLPILQKTRFGWVISGRFFPKKYIQKDSSGLSCNFSSINNSLENMLEKFWSVEEYSYSEHLSPEEKTCEELFVKSTVRNPDGRFVVQLPFKISPSCLGDSKEIALKRFYSLEKKFQKNPPLKKEYSDFIREYETLGHMTRIDSVDHEKPHFYLPHHCVFKESSTTTKVRVVFDGSSKTSSGFSLNDILCVGPTIQNDLFSIILRSRKHKIVLIGDIAKMYRQVLIKNNQRNLQLILWRSDPDSEIQTYQLNTVTYGTASASYLSTRCLLELAHECSKTDPELSKIISNDFYVDDLFTGGSSVEDVLNIKTRILLILNSGGFELRKLMSNNIEVVKEQPSSETLLFFDQSLETKTLGLTWDSRSDTFKYSICSNNDTSFTKRTILSTIAKIFDPLGLIAPIIIVAKILIQRLWQSKIDWDESIPLDIYRSWINFRSHLIDINNINIPRYILSTNTLTTELHCFSDASEQAYGACIFIRTIDTDNSITVNLLCAKTRVSPLKIITMPRLELCAALLGAQLLNKVKDSLDIKVDEYFCWCDSQIVLSWILSPSHHWKIFVGNRVSQIQTLTSSDAWFYINSKENPADLLSRGVTPGDLINNQLWWKGPTWLSASKEKWPTYSPTDESVCDIDVSNERKTVKPLSFTVTTNENNFDLLTKFSSFTKLQRVTAYCIRFSINCKNPDIKRTGSLDTKELTNALNILIRLIQNDVFAKEFSTLNNSKSVNNKSKLIKLHPFIDRDNIIRVGGRLRHSNYNYDKKFPIILPGKHYFSKLLVEYEHKRLLHAGPQLLLSSIREKFWILSGRNLVRQVVRNCTVCYRCNPVPSEHLMGDLPSYRISQCRPFFNVGVDFCGPFMLKDRAPHFGGLWEAGVKSAKFHIKRVMKDVPLTYEEFLTILTQIEACLNSRPLYPLTNDPSDIQPLTPSHFLIGERITTIPEDDYTTIPNC